LRERRKDTRRAYSGTARLSWRSPKKRSSTSRAHRCGRGDKEPRSGKNKSGLPGIKPARETSAIRRNRHTTPRTWKKILELTIWKGKSYKKEEDNNSPESAIKKEIRIQKQNREKAYKLELQIGGIHP